MTDTTGAKIPAENCAHVQMNDHAKKLLDIAHAALLRALPHVLNDGDFRARVEVARAIKALEGVKC